MFKRKIRRQMKATFTTCRSCGGPVPETSIQGSNWHRECANCYVKDGLPVNPFESKEIAITIDGISHRIFPHLTKDGLLAMRELKMMESYVLLANGDVRQRPDSFEMPEDMPQYIIQEIEQSFILPRERAILVRRIFRAYAENDFEVID